MTISFRNCQRKASAKATAAAKATTNTGVLRFAQDDGEKQKTNYGKGKSNNQYGGPSLRSG
jgi:hypothetical protein